MTKLCPLRARSTMSTCEMMRLTCGLIVWTYLCLFGVFVLIENFSPIWRRYHDRGERLQILTYARHLWPLRSDGFLAFNPYFDTGHPFIMVISEDRWNSPLLPSAASACFYDLGLSRLGFEHRLRGKRSTLAHCTTAAALREYNRQHSYVDMQHNYVQKWDNYVHVGKCWMLT